MKEKKAPLQFTSLESIDKTHERVLHLITRFIHQNKGVLIEMPTIEELVQNMISHRACHSFFISRRTHKIRKLVTLKKLEKFFVIWVPLSFISTLLNS
jgi:hypothetical protein